MTSGDERKLFLKLPSFHTDNQVNKSAFVMVELDPFTTALNISHYSFDSGVYHYDENNSLKEKIYIKDTLMIPQSILPINKNKYDDFLRRGLSSIQLEKFITFEDSYIPPILQKHKVEELDENTTFEYCSQTELGLSKLGKITMFSGKSLFGKSTILKQYFIESYRDGLIPIYISFSDKDNRVSTIDDQYKRFCKDFYPNSKDYIDQHMDRIVILLDNLHFYKDNLEALFSSLNKSKYAKILITINTVEYSTYNVERCSENMYDLYKIQPFGFSQKYELVNRWVNLDHSLLDIEQKNRIISEINALLKQISFSDSNINTAEMTLIFLEAYKDLKPQALMNGSRGVYYSYLFTKYVLQLSAITKLDQQFIDEFLSEYSYFIFSSNDQPSINFDDLYLSGHTVSKKEYLVKKAALISAMKQLEIIHRDSEEVRFRHMYIVSYFCAKYYVANIDYKMNELKELILHIDEVEKANVLLFVMDFTKNIALIDSIVEVSKTIFQETPEIDLDEDIKIVNSFIYGVKDVELFGSIIENNKKLSERLDKETGKKTKKQVKAELTEAEEKIQKELIRAFKMREILIELLNQTTNTPIVKKLVDANFALGLRKAGDFLSLFGKYIKWLRTRTKQNWDDEHTEYYRDMQLAITTLALILIDNADHLAPRKSDGYVMDFLSKLTTPVGELTFALIEFYYSRHEENFAYKNVVRLLEKYRKEGSLFSLGVLHIVVDREVNLIGVDNERKKKELLLKTKAPDLPLREEDPKKNLDFSKTNKKNRTGFISKLFGRKRSV